MPLTTELLLRHMSDAVLGVDAAWTVTFANGRAESLLRAPASRLVGRPLEECLPDLADSRAAAQLLAAARSRAVESRIDHFSPSRYTWFEVRVVAKDDGYVLFMRDVTDRVRQTRSEAVREAVREIVMEAPVAISITRGPDHRYELVNSMARQLLGGRNIEGQTARAAFPEIAASLFSTLDEVYRTGRAFAARDLEVTFDRQGNGTLVTGTFDVTYQPLFEADGDVSGILSISVETTEYAGVRHRLAPPAPAEDA